MGLRCAISVPNFGDAADPRTTADLARQAEAAGWHGFFVWDHVHAAFEPGMPLADPWVLLTAVGLATERIRIGTMVTPVARRRPWVLARQTVTLDRLSDGRLTLGVGLGFPPDLEFAAFGEDADDRRRADKLDEALELLVALWSGDEVDHDGVYFDVHGVRFAPTPVQRPRIPIWVAQMWPHLRPLRRAARWDGVVPMHETDMFPSPDQVEEVTAIVRSHRVGDAPFDVCVPVVLDGDRERTAQIVEDFESAGATWLQVGAWSTDELRAVIAAGPPSG